LRWLCVLLAQIKMVETVDIAMARSGRDSMIAMSCLWLLFAATVGLRFYGRMRGPGLALDDIFAGVALVLSTSTIGLNALGMHRTR
jgi:hypothetical protein